MTSACQVLASAREALCTVCGVRALALPYKQKPGRAVGCAYLLINGLVVRFCVCAAGADMQLFVLVPCMCCDADVTRPGSAGLRDLWRFCLAVPFDTWLECCCHCCCCCCTGKCWQYVYRWMNYGVSAQMSSTPVAMSARAQGACAPFACMWMFVRHYASVMVLCTE